MNPIHKEIYKGYKITIEQEEGDFEIFNPRNSDNLGKMHCFYKGYELGDKKPTNITPASLLTIVNKPNVIKLPLRVYEHSGLWISTSSEYPFNCPWDSSFVGYIYCTKKDIQKNFRIRKVTSEYIEKALEIMQSEVREYNSWLIGEVYGYIIENKEGKHLESCCGFIGDYNFCLKEARNYIDNAPEIQLELFKNLNLTTNEEDDIINS
jgi:hypothetical protein